MNQYKNIEKLAYEASMQSRKKNAPGSSEPISSERQARYTDKSPKQRQVDLKSDKKLLEKLRSQLSNQYRAGSLQHQVHVKKQIAINQTSSQSSFNKIYSISVRRNPLVDSNHLKPRKQPRKESKASPDTTMLEFPAETLSAEKSKGKKGAVGAGKQIAVADSTAPAVNSKMKKVETPSEILSAGLKIARQRSRPTTYSGISQSALSSRRSSKQRSGQTSKPTEPTKLKPKTRATKMMQPIKTEEEQITKKINFFKKQEHMMKNYQAIEKPEVTKQATIQPHSLNSPKLLHSPRATDHAKSIDHQTEIISPLPAAAVSATKKNPKISSKRQNLQKMHFNSYQKFKNQAYAFDGEVDFEKINTIKRKRNTFEKKQVRDPQTTISSSFKEATANSSYSQINLGQKTTLINRVQEQSRCNSHGRDMRLLTVLSEHTHQSNLSLDKVARQISPKPLAREPRKNQQAGKSSIGDNLYYKVSQKAKQTAAQSAEKKSLQIGKQTPKGSNEDEANYFSFNHQAQIGKIKNRFIQNKMENSSQRKKSGKGEDFVLQESQASRSPYSGGSPRDEEIQASDDEDKFFMQNDTIKKNKFLIEPSIVGSKIQPKPVQVMGSVNGYGRRSQMKIRSFKIEENADQANISVLTDNSRVSHTRLETQLLDQEQKFPQKNARFDAYSIQKNIAQQGRSPIFQHKNSIESSNSKTAAGTIHKKGRLSSDIFAFSKTHKERKLSEFNVLVGNKLSLRLQNLKVLLPAHFEHKSNLTHIDLRNNRLQKLPDQLCDLILLREIRLDYNFIKRLPFGLSRLQHLQFLSASQNLLKHLPQSLFHRKSQLEYLVLNDNKIAQISTRIGNLKSLKSLLLHNNQIFEIPANLCKIKGLQELGLDWFLYLHREHFQNEHENQGTAPSASKPLFLSNQTKIMKGILKNQNTTIKGKATDVEEQQKHQNIIDHLVDLCKYMQILNFVGRIEKLKEQNQQNPQQDDYYEESNNHPTNVVQTQGQLYYNVQSASGGVNQSNSESGLNQAEYGNSGQSNRADLDYRSNYQKLKVTFLHFLMFFNRIVSIDDLVMKKAFYPSKQRKLSHLIALYGHQYLFSSIVNSIREYQKHNHVQRSLRKFNIHGGLRQSSEVCSTIMSQAGSQTQTTLYQFVNAVDKDFSTPLILALKNKRHNIVKLLMENDKVCLKQSSMRYGTPLHVALSNEDFKNSLKIIRLLKKTKNFTPEQDLNKFDEEGNTPLHIVMKNFNVDIQKSRKIAMTLIKMGASLIFKNKLQNNPLNQALYFGQNEAVRFALNHNSQIRRRDGEQTYALFDFNDSGGKLRFSAMHHAVFQGNFQIITMLLESKEPLNLDQQDTEGRIPLELCFSISTVFKTLRRAYRKQQSQFIKQNEEKFQELQNKKHKFLLRQTPNHQNINVKSLNNKVIKSEIESVSSLNQAKAGSNMISESQIDRYTPSNLPSGSVTSRTRLPARQDRLHDQLPSGIMTARVHTLAPIADRNQRNHFTYNLEMPQKQQGISQESVLKPQSKAQRSGISSPKSNDKKQQSQYFKNNQKTLNLVKKVENEFVPKRDRSVDNLFVARAELKEGRGVDINDPLVRMMTEVLKVRSINEIKKQGRSREKEGPGQSENEELVDAMSQTIVQKHGSHGRTTMNKTIDEKHYFREPMSPIKGKKSVARRNREVESSLNSELSYFPHSARGANGLIKRQIKHEENGAQPKMKRLPTNEHRQTETKANKAASLVQRRDTSRHERNQSQSFMSQISQIHEKDNASASEEANISDEEEHSNKNSSNMYLSQRGDSPEPKSVKMKKRHKQNADHKSWQRRKDVDTLSSDATSSLSSASCSLSPRSTESHDQLEGLISNMNIYSQSDQQISYSLLKSYDLPVSEGLCWLEMADGISQSLRGQQVHPMPDKVQSGPAERDASQSQNCNFDISDENENDSVRNQMALDLKRHSPRPAEGIRVMGVREGQKTQRNDSLRELNDENLLIHGMSQEFDESEDIANVGTVKQEDNRGSNEPFDLQQFLNYNNSMKYQNDVLQRTEKMMVPQLNLNVNLGINETDRTQRRNRAAVDEVQHTKGDHSKTRSNIQQYSLKGANQTRQENPRERLRHAEPSDNYKCSNQFEDNESGIEDENEIIKPLVTSRNFTVRETQRQNTHNLDKAHEEGDVYGVRQAEGTKNYSTVNQSDLPHEDEYYGLSQQTQRLTQNHIKTSQGILQQNLLRANRAESQLRAEQKKHSNLQDLVELQTLVQKHILKIPAHHSFSIDGSDRMRFQQVLDKINMSIYSASHKDFQNQKITIIEQIIADMKLPAQNIAFFNQIALKLENVKVQLINISSIKFKEESLRKNVIQEFMKKRPALLKTLKPKSSVEDFHEVDLIKSVEFLQKQQDEGLQTNAKSGRGSTGQARYIENGQQFDNEGPTTPIIKNLMRSNKIMHSGIMINNLNLNQK